MNKKILHYWKGYLKIDIRGNALGRFISQISEEGILLWDIEYLSYDHYRAYLYKDDYNRLRPLLRRRKCQVRIIEKRGFPFLFLQIRRRVFLLLGILMILFIFKLGTSFLWSYEFKGLENIEEETILEVLEEAGIRKGILKKDLDLMEIENYLLQRIPAISWADLSWQGTRLTVDLVEKKLVKPVEKGTLVASKDGIISKLIVLKGQALVKEGDTVTEGQVLVLPGSDGEARAIIKAEIWYEARAESPLKEQLIINTGKKRTKWGVKLADRLIRFSTTIPPYDQYRLKRSSKKIFAWRNISLPIELFKEEYQEIKILEMNNSAELALFKAKEKALAGILLHIEEGSLIESVYLEVVENEDNNNEKIKLRLMIKTEENIACLKEDFSGRN